MASPVQFLVLSIWIFHLFILPAEGKRPNPEALFVFGDSYSDTGNHDPAIPLYNIPWLPPFGITWPHKKGQGGGRYSDGKISTDILAELLGLPTPATYRSYVTDPSATPASLRYGISFGSGGAGVFKTFDVPTIYQQVESFHNITATFPDVFTSDIIAKSVVLFVNVGNDYGFFTSSPDELPAYSQSVVNAMADNLKNLHQLGLRNFIVSNIQPGGCLPLYGFAGSLTPTTCATDPAGNALAQLHNSLLAVAISNLQSTLSQSHFVILDAFKAFSFVLANSKLFGITSPPLAPCCEGRPGTTASLLGVPLPRCGFTDAQGPIYTVCEDPTKSFFWDEAHPTQTAYTALYNLFFSGYNLTFPEPNLLFWTYTSNFAPKPYRRDEQLPPDLLKALQEDGQHNYLLLNARVEFLISHLPDIISSTGPLTLFLPSDAYFGNRTELDQSLPIATAIGAEVLNNIAVAGYFPAERLLKKRSGSSVRTLSARKLPVFPGPNGLYLGAEDQSGGGAKVIAPDLFVKRGQLVVHGTDAVPLPSSLLG